MDYNWNLAIVLSELPQMLSGLRLGLLLAISAAFIGMLIGLIFAFCSISKNNFLVTIARVYVTVLRNTPLLILVFIVYFGLPDINVTLGKVSSFIFALSIYGGAYTTEIFRSGLQSIPKGLIEAGHAIGLSKLQISVHIQLPIMFKNVLPALSNYLISLFKDTSLAASIAIIDLTYQARKVNTLTFRVFEVWLITALLYIITCYLIAFLLRKIERRYAIN